MGVPREAKSGPGHDTSLRAHVRGRQLPAGSVYHRELLRDDLGCACFQVTVAAHGDGGVSRVSPRSALLISSAMVLAFHCGARIPVESCIQKPARGSGCPSSSGCGAPMRIVPFILKADVVAAVLPEPAPRPFLGSSIGLGRLALQRSFLNAIHQFPTIIAPGCSAPTCERRAAPCVAARRSSLRLPASKLSQRSRVTFAVRFSPFVSKRMK